MHQEAKRFAREGYDILLVGHAGHEEVEGTAGEAPEHIQLVETAADAASVTVRDPEKVVWLSQTTLSVDETMDTVRALRERLPGLQNPPSDDICYATQNRQTAVKAMAPQCDLVLVVGSVNSSNSVRLVEVALQAGAGAAHLIDYARQIDDAWLDGVATIGVTSGASVPEVLVRGVLEHLAERGWTEVEELTTAEETLTFALPRELRPCPGFTRWVTSRNRPSASTSPVVHAIIGKPLTSGAPITSRRCAMPAPGRGVPATSTTTGTATAMSSGGATIGQNRPLRRTQAVASTQPAR